MSQNRRALYSCCNHGWKAPTRSGSNPPKHHAVSTLRTLLDLQPLPEDSAQESRAGCDTRPPEHPEFCSRWGSCGARAGPEQNWEVIYEIQRLGLRAPLSLGGLAGAHVHVSVRDAEIRLERLRLDLGSCSWLGCLRCAKGKQKRREKEREGDRERDDKQQKDHAPP